MLPTATSASTDGKQMVKWQIRTVLTSTSDDNRKSKYWLVMETTPPQIIAIHDCNWYSRLAVLSIHSELNRIEKSIHLGKLNGNVFPNRNALTGTRQWRCDYISPVLYQLDWLPVWQRVVFKIATLVHRSLSGNAPGYLADDCQLVADVHVRQLRCANTQTLLVSRTRSSFGDRTFAGAGPQVWNSLPPNLRLCGLSYGQFRQLVKTFLFRQCGHGAVWTVFNCAE